MAAGCVTAVYRRRLRACHDCDLLPTEKLSLLLVLSLIAPLPGFCFAEPSSPPRNVRARLQSGTTAVIQWEVPLQPNGVIQEYHVHYVIARSPERQPERWPLQRTSWTFVILSDLRTNESYFVAVRAVTNAGQGLLSETITIATVPGSIKQQHSERFVSDRLTIRCEQPDTTTMNGQTRQPGSTAMAQASSKSVALLFTGGWNVSTSAPDGATPQRLSAKSSGMAQFGRSTPTLTALVCFAVILLAPIQ